MDVKFRVQWKGGSKWLTDSVHASLEEAERIMVQMTKHYPMSDWRILREEVVGSWPPRRANTAAVR